METDLHNLTPPLRSVFQFGHLCITVLELRSFPLVKMPRTYLARNVMIKSPLKHKITQFMRANCHNEDGTGSVYKGCGFGL